MADNNNNNNNNANENNFSGGDGSNSTNHSRTSSTTTTRISTAAGVLIRTLRKGNGIYPQQGDRCTVHYEGYLEDGTMFVSSKKKSSQSQTPQNQNQPIQFMLGMGHVIEGWDAAVARMTKHQIAEVTIPHLFAYGEQGYPPKIPPRSTLIFKLELVDFTSTE